MMPWWGWALIALWCLLAAYSAVALLLQKPIDWFDENGNDPGPISIRQKIILFPVLFALLVLYWPLILWSEYRQSRRNLQEIRSVRKPLTLETGLPDEPAKPVEDSPEGLVAPPRVAALTEIGKQACLFPACRVVIDPSWLTSDVVALASGIDAERAFDRMPILADALQDAGCDNEGLLKHCRQPGGHVCGCWAIKLLLGKAPSS